MTTRHVVTRPVVTRPVPRGEPPVLEFHEGFAWATIAANGLVGVWATAAHWTTWLRRRALWWFVAVAQVSIFVQVISGVWLVAVDDIEADQMHMFYGFLAIIAVAILYGYRSQLAPYRFLLYGLGSLFVMGLLIQGMIFGGAPAA